MAIARCIDLIKMRLYRCWLDGGLICIQVLNVDAHEWLPARFGDIGKNWGKVGSRLVRVGEGRVKGLRLVPKHACGSKGSVMLQMSVVVSRAGSMGLLLSACIGRRAWRSTGISRRESCRYSRGMAPMGYQVQYSP
jgi:hypothetical protein